MSVKKLYVTGGSIIPQSDWNQTDATQADFIKNKPEDLATGAYVDEQVANLNVSIAQNAQAISRNNKRLTNIEQGIPVDEFLTDRTVAYQKDVPASALPCAKISNLGGMTRKCTNLIPFPYFHDSGRVSAGVTYTVNPDGSVTENGVATEFSNFIFSQTLDLVSGKTYTKTNGVALAYQDADGSVKYANNTFVWDDSYTLLQIYMQTAPGVTASRTIYPMLNEGSTALPYEPYFEGLRDAKVTEIESVGANLFGGEVLADKFVELSNATKDEVAGTVVFAAPNASGDVYFSDFKPDTVYTFILYGKTTSNAMANLNVFYTDGTKGGIAFTAVDTEGYCVYTTTSGKTVDRFSGSNMSGITTLYYDKCGIFEGVLTADDFKPYVCNTLPIPEAVQALDGYGDGVNESVYNYIDYEKKQFVKRVEKIVIDGTKIKVNSVSRYTNDFYYAVAPLSSVGIEGDDNAINSHFEVRMLVKPGYCYIIAKGKNFVMVNNNQNLTTPELWNAWLKEHPVTFVYKLAAPEIVDISDILPADNLLGVEGGGMLTFKNQFEYDVPSEITYQLDQEEVTAE